MQEALQKGCAGQIASTDRSVVLTTNAVWPEAALPELPLVWAAFARDGANGCARAARAGQCAGGRAKVLLLAQVWRENKKGERGVNRPLSPSNRPAHE